MFGSILADAERTGRRLMGKNCDNKKKAPRLRAGLFVLSLLTRGDSSLSGKEHSYAFREIMKNENLGFFPGGDEALGSLLEILAGGVFAFG